jgi:uncharacterized protein (DUF927 family)
MQQYHPTVHDLLSSGYSIIPVRLDKKPHWNLLPKGADGKATWKFYQERQPNADEFAVWEKAHPPAYGVVTGRISGVVTFDFDGDQGMKLALEWGVKAHRQSGSGGLHWDVRYPGHYVPTLNGKQKVELGHRWPGLDIKGDGGYAVALGRNQSGRYQWMREIDPDPAELVSPEVWQFLRDCANPPVNGKRRGGPNVPSEILIKKALSQIPTAGRNDAGFWLACQLRDNGYDIADARSVMAEYGSLCPQTNAKGEREEYSDREMQATIDQAYSRPPRDPWRSPADAPTPDGPPPPKRKGPSPFSITPNAVLLVNDDGGKEFVCSHLRVDARTRDSKGSEWGRLLVWTDSEGREKEWAMPMELLAGDGIELRKELLRGGLIPGYSRHANQHLLHYILSEQPNKYACCVPKLGWHNDVVYVLPDAAIPHNTKERVIYQAPAQIQHFYNTAGTLDDWRSQISVLCRGNSRLIFAVSLAFAGPLLGPLGIEGGGFHFANPTSIGKSTTQLVGGSVLGGGNGDHGFCRSWRHTSNGLESVALIHNDSLLILDELREMADPKEVETCIYMLANGSIKGRHPRFSNNRPAATWRILFLSSGEFPLSEYAAAAGRKIRGGAEVRLINLPADAGAGLGIFESLNGESSPGCLAEKLKNAALSIYGSPFRAFLEALFSDRDKYLNWARRYTAEFVSDNLPAGAATEVRRALRRFAVAAVAGEMVTDMGVVDWEADTATWAATRLFNTWIEDRGGIGQADMQAALRQVRAFFEAHGSSRFQTVLTRMDKSGDAIDERVINRAGYWKRDEDGQRLFLVFPEVFRHDICAAFDAESVARELARQDLLIKGDGKNLTRREAVPDQSRPRFYVIRGRILE